MEFKSLEERVADVQLKINKWNENLSSVDRNAQLDETQWRILWQHWLAARPLHEEHSLCSLCLHEQRRARRESEKPGVRRIGPHIAIKLAAKWTDTHQTNDETADPPLPWDVLKRLGSSLSVSIEVLCEGERLIREWLLKFSPETFDREELSKHIEFLDLLLIRNNRDTRLSDLEEARRALSLVHQARFVKRLFQHLDGRAGSFQADVISETFSIGEVEWYQRALALADIEHSYGEVYRDGLSRELLAFENHVTELITSFTQNQPDQPALHDILREAWRSLLWGGELLVTLHVSPAQNVDDLISSCRTVRSKLQTEIQTCAEGLSFGEFEEVFTELSWELLYYSSDLMSEIDHTSLSCSIFRLECVYDDLLWYLGWERGQKTSKKDQGSHYQAAVKRLKKQTLRVRVELQEKRLQSRLEVIFGQDNVRRFEQLVFFLIFAVLGLLFYELIWVHESDFATRRTLALIDTGICLVFLTEFIVKISLAQERLFYFKRRWFIDLLPSIPFVFFTDYLFLDHLVVGRSARLVKISRLARYIRIVRPFIRIVRLVSFTLRGMDRLIRRYSQWLNHNLVFFEPAQSIYHRPEESELEHATSVYADSLALSRQLTAQLNTNELASLLPVYIETLQYSLNDQSGEMTQSLDHRVSAVQRMRDIPVEHAIHKLIHLQGAELEAQLGYGFPKRLYTFVGLFDVPLVNRLPLLNQVLIKRRNSTASEFAAWWIRSFGKILEALMSLGYWFADLYGVVTGPKIIDRVGSTLVRSFERPAKRLLIFGGLLLTLQLAVSGLGITFLSKVVTPLQRFVGLPMIIIGSICFVPLVLGRWMKRIADQAEELFRLTAEAQFINLLKDLKEERAAEDLSLIYHRVVAPEEDLCGLIKDPAEREARQKQFVESVSGKIKRPLDLFGDHYCAEDDPNCELFEASSAFAPLKAPNSSSDHPTSMQVTPKSDLYWIDRKLNLLYRDYLDGALLHSTDIKTTEQLLGNLSMRSFFDYKLNLTSTERKAIERLDLGTHRSLIGPYMWFSLITQSVSQAAAQLVIDYNRFALPIDARPSASPEMLSLFEDWVNHKNGKSVGREELELKKRDVAPFNTTDITILHILASRGSYEHEIRMRFGPEVLSLLTQDQRHLVRGVFSSYPLHQLPKPMRTLNPYLLYNEFIQGSRLLILPFRLFGIVLKSIIIGIKWTKEKIDEIRFPEKSRAEIIPQKDYIVATRKIDRMRKPIFMKLLQLRAQVDYAYLGINVEDDHPNHEQAEVHRDLDSIKAIEVERLPIIDMIEANQSSLREYYEYLTERGLTGDALKGFLQDKHPHLLPRRRELLRAYCTAYLCDFKNIQSYLQTKIKLAEFFTDSLNGLPNQPFKLHKRVLVSATRSTKRLVQRGKDFERVGFDLFWERLGFGDRTSEERNACWQRYLNEGRDLHPLLIRFAQDGLPNEEAIFDEILQNLTMWTDELIALRSVQTLSLMDIENYRRYIWAVGSYADDQDHT